MRGVGCASGATERAAFSMVLPRSTRAEHQCADREDVPDKLHGSHLKEIRL